MRADEVVLDEDQRRVVEAEPDRRQIVTAGPGAGKTEVVAGLVRHLIDAHETYPEEILVVSFSRAAVHAVRRRLADTVTDAHLVSVRTLDSLAYELMVESGEQVAGFDATVRAATATLEANGWQFLEQIRHIIVDEVQDIVGIRARLVLALLHNIEPDAGYTLLGDPLQAIYDFQLTEAGKRDRVRLLDIVECDAALTNHCLSNEYRSRSADASSAAVLRKNLLEATDDLVRRTLVEDFAANLVSIGDLEAEGQLIERWTGTTAVLCRDNIDVLRAAGMLRAAGLHATVQRAATEQSYAPWIAQLFGDVPSTMISRQSFLALAETVQLDDADLAWSALRRTAESRGADLDLRALARGLRAGRRCVDLESSPATQVVVTTVHRAKGLQFDNVVLVNATNWLRDADAESIRVLFVALTRSRDRLAVATLRQERGWMQSGPNERYFRRGPQRWQTFGVEIRGADTRGLGPTSEPMINGVGRAVSWRLDRDTSNLTVPFYQAIQNDHVVARTTREFGEDLEARIGSAERRATPWPSLGAGGFVEALETVAGNPAANVGPGRHGLWLSARISGVIDLAWREQS
ncbi:UvrD-helicase domain-containing protein [Micromonospora sp. DPT]|uniref:UvrD-helicase domain-containing protein n=1 Tax=Micromonospora sp. DPT TaxID=3142975 RepID=UPI0032090196